jgi:lipoate-protein ligase B
VSVNIDTDNGYFGLINPCGMAGLRMAALSDIIGTRVPMAEAVGGLARSFKAIFGLEGDCERMDPADVRVSGYGAAQMSKYGGTL